MAQEPRRLIRKDRLAALVASKRGVAKAMAGRDATTQDVEDMRRLIQKHVSDGGARPVLRMDPSTARRYELALGVSRDEFLEPVPDPREAEIARLSRRMARLRRELDAEHEQTPLDE